MTTDRGPSTAGGRGRLVALLAAVAALVAAVVLLPVNAWLEQLLTWVEGLGVWGPVSLVSIYVVACVLMLPGSVLTLGAGALFGVGLGSVTVSVGATLGATAAFLVGRYVTREAIAARTAGNPRFAAIDGAVAQQGFKIVLLTRLSPVFPFNLLNYAYGLTGVSLRDYVVGSWLGMIPGTIMYVYLGYAGRTAVAAGSEGKSTAEYALLGVGLAATIAVTVVVTRIALGALRREVDLDEVDGVQPVES